MRTHYIDTATTTEIAERAKALRDGVTTMHVIERGEERDSLADIATVIGDAPRLLTQDVLQCLAALNEDAYGGWTFVDLKRVMDGTGAEPHKSDGSMVVGRDHIMRALAIRPETDFASAAEQLGRPYWQRRMSVTDGYMTPRTRLQQSCSSLVYLRGP